MLPRASVHVQLSVQPQMSRQGAQKLHAAIPLVLPASTAHRHGSTLHLLVPGRRGGEREHAQPGITHRRPFPGLFLMKRNHLDAEISVIYCQEHEKEKKKWEWVWGEGRSFQFLPAYTPRSFRIQDIAEWQPPCCIYF